jgi:hypothetical protein
VAQVHHHLGGVVEPVAVGVGDAEQLADHQAGDRQRECLDQVDRLGCGLDRVEVLGDDPVDVGLQVLLHGLRGEAAGEQPAEQAVVRLVHEHEAGVELAAGVVRVVGLVVGQGVVPGAVGAHPRVGEHGAALVEAGDEPADEAVREADAGDRRVLAERVVLDRRVEEGRACGGHDGQVGLGHEEVSSVSVGRVSAAASAAVVVGDVAHRHPARI